jgi:nucleotide-binding universal stress UspA family protein
MRLSHRPTMLVRPLATEGVPTPVKLGHILVPLDGSALSEAALDPAVEIAQASGARMTLLRAVPFLTSTVDWDNSYVSELVEIEAEMRDDAKNAIEQSRKQIPAGIDVSVVVLNGPPALEIEAFIKERAVDLTVMTTHGRGGLARAVVGSTADRLVHAGDPILLLHPNGAAGQEQPSSIAAAAPR